MARERSESNLDLGDVGVTLDEHNRLMIEDEYYPVWIQPDKLVMFYTWLGDHMEARGLLNG